MQQSAQSIGSTCLFDIVVFEEKVTSGMNIGTLQLSSHKRLISGFRSIGNPWQRENPIPPLPPHIHYWLPLTASINAPANSISKVKLLYISLIVLLMILISFTQSQYLLNVAIEISPSLINLSYLVPLLDKEFLLLVLLSHLETKIETL